MAAGMSVSAGWRHLDHVKEVAMGSSPRVLIVDEEEYQRKELRDLCSHEGYETRALRLGVDVIEQVARETYDAVLLGLPLPDTHRAAILRALHSLDPQIPVIVLTDSVTDPNTVDWLPDRAFAWFTKPHKPDELRATVRRALTIRGLEEMGGVSRRTGTASDAGFRSLVESAPDAIIVADGSGAIVSWNHSAQRLFQYSAEEIVGRPLSLLMPESYREAHRIGLTRVVATGESRFCGRTIELEGLRKDGSVFPLELSLATWGTLRERYFSGILRDITERKRAEQVICETQDRFRQLAEHIRDVFWLTDPHAGTLLYVSPTYELIWGRSCESRYESPHSWLESVHPEDRRRVEQAACTKQMEGSYDEEYRLARPDGSVRWIHDRAFPVHDTSGAVVRIAGLAADITDQKMVHEALRRAHQRTASILASLPGAILIADRTGTIRYASPRVQQQLSTCTVPLIGQSMTRMLALPTDSWSRWVEALAPQTSGELARTPQGELTLNARAFHYEMFPVFLGQDDHPDYGLILCDITEQAALRDQLIQAEKLASLGTLVSGMAHEVNNPVQGILSTAELIQDETDPEQIKAFAKDIVEFSRHVAAVVRNFSMYARPSSRDNETNVDLCERLKEAIRMVRRGPHFGRIAVVDQLAPVPPVRASRTEIDQVFVNLISNAVQAMRGEGRLTVSTREDGSMALATVSDTGCGIPEPLQDKIFEPFFTTKESGKGTGLGLSIVHKIVKKYGGSIGVTSEPGRGTTFSVHFPLSTLTPEGGTTCPEQSLRP